ncbi:MAG: glycosyl transferase family 1 [Chloroflexus sp.]|uniref:glycosyltransferase family 4 protein n=1 Tax=Chloroflexus sp. TaxID=1904827 RepID=UPI0021DE1EDA|nr:glycosyltransferase family 4 protein [Chloroflexus sp.]GIV87118.1 MAG: glycosyl transferase family 1 [Chloroflexus sp.]
MRILLAVHHFPPHYSAGAELYTMRLAHELLRRGDECEVVCVETLDTEQPFGVRAERDYYNNIPVWRLHLGLRDAPANWSYANPAITAWFEQRIQVFQPDIVHLQSGYLIGVGAINAAHAQDISTVVTLHDYWFLCPRITLLRGDGSLCRQPPSDPAECAWCLQLDQRRYRLPERFSAGLVGKVWITLVGDRGRAAQQVRRDTLRAALAQADLVIAPSHFLASLFREWVPHVQVVRLGITQEHLHQVQPVRPGQHLRIGYIGQIAPHKGVHLLITAFKRLPRSNRPAELIIFGNSDQNPAYTNHLRRLIGDDPDIQIAGKFRHDQLADVLSKVDVIVVPSIWYENSPITILEAHAAGRPVICSRLGGMVELVRDEVDGLLFTPNDDRDLARQLQRLRTEPGLLERLCDSIQPPRTFADELQEILQHYTTLSKRRTTV